MADEEIVTARSDRGGESESSLGHASLIDFDETKGLTKVFTDLVKPIANLNDPSKRDRASIMAKNIRYLSKITPENIEQAVNEDQASLRDTVKGLLTEIKIARLDIRELKSKQLGDSHKFERKVCFYIIFLWI